MITKTFVGGDNINNNQGNFSTVTLGLNESVNGSRIEIVGSPNMIRKSPQEYANRNLAEWVAVNSQPNTKTDTSLLSLPEVSEIFKPAPNLLDCVVCPKAEDIDETEQVPDTSIMGEITNYVNRVKNVASKCTLETAKEMATVQKKHMKDKATATIESKKKMFSKMPKMSLAAFKENIGKVMFPEDKNQDPNKKEESTFETLTNTASNTIKLVSQIVSNPLSLIGLFMSPTTDPEKTPQKEFYDKNKAQEVAVRVADKRRDSEMNCM